MYFSVTTILGLLLSLEAQAWPTGLETTIRKLESSINAHDLNGFFSSMDDNLVVKNSGLTSTKTEFRASLEQVLGALPDLKVSLIPIDSAGGKIAVLEIASGTHSGKLQFFGFPPSGKRVTFTALHIMEVRLGRVVDMHSQPNFGPVIATLAQGAPAANPLQLRADLAEAAAVSQISNKNCRSSPESLERAWHLLTQIMERKVSGKSGFVDAVIDSKRYRLSYSDSMNADRAASLANIEAVGAISKGATVNGMRTIFSGPRFVAKYGPARIRYYNPEGKMGLPPSAAELPLSFNELQLIGICGGKVVRHYSHMDSLGLIGKIMAGKTEDFPDDEGPSHEKQIAREFLEAFEVKDYVKVRSLLNRDFVHTSPFGKFEGADAFIKIHKKTFGTQDWSYRLASLTSRPGQAIAIYDSILKGQPALPLIEIFTFNNGKLSAATVYRADAPVPMTSCP